MATLRTRRGQRQSAVASILALLLIAVFAALAVAFFASTGMNLVKASNSSSAFEARLAAESGLSFLVREVTTSGVSGCLRGQALLNALAAQIKADLNGKPNLAGKAVGYDGATITIPEIVIDDGKSFSALITVPAYDVIKLHVTGYLTRGAGPNQTTLQRQLTINVDATGNPAFSYGVCSKGPIAIGMNMDLFGAVHPLDASLYSGAPGLAISGGSGYISGDVSVSDPNATISLGSTQVGGTVRYGVPPITMPQVDRSLYKPLATHLVDSNTNTSNGTFKNIRIKANTNPIFGSVTIQGVMYVEAPNYIQFTSDVNFTGVIVADDPPAGSPDSANYIYFKNNTSFHGVEELPDTPEFAQVRKLPGSSVLAPAFTMEFKNNFGSIDGLIALKGLIAKNNESATLYGSILIYGDEGLSFKNNSIINITIDTSKYSGVAPGFQGYGQPTLTVDPKSYTEP